MRRFVALLLLTVLLSGCAAPAAVSTGEGYYTFSDSTGTQVYLSQKPEKVAVLFSSFAEVWLLSGGTVDVTVGESVERGFAEADAVLVDAGAGKTVDLERLLAECPDFVIASADIPAQVDACARLREAGIPCALFRVDTFRDYLAMLKICTDITGDGDAYLLHGEQVAQQITDILAQVEALDAPRKDILFIRAGSQYSSTKAKRAPENFVCIMLGELGAHNIADDAPVLLDGLSQEEILLRSPQHIFLTTMGSEDAARQYIGELFEGPLWREVDAVRNGNYTFLPKELFHFKPNGRWAQAYRYLAECLYPELKNHE